MNLLRIILAPGFTLLFSSHIFAQITIVAEATDTGTMSTIRVESLIPNPFGPALLVVSVNPNQYSAAEFNIVNGTMKAFADDSGNQIDGFVAASCNLNEFRIKNVTGGALTIDPGDVEILFNATHLIDGTPVDTGTGTGEKTAYVTYTVLAQAFIGSTSTGFGLTQNRVIAVWNEDGSLEHRRCDPPADSATNGGWVVTEVACDGTGITIKVEAPVLVLDAGETLNVRAQIVVIADSDNEGLSARGNAT